MPRIAFGPQVCGRIDEGAVREWLVPDGRGGYAMGTVSGLRTRRYHGLLMVAGATPADRHLGLAALDPVLTPPSGAVVRLGTHEWSDGTVAPSGHELLASFELVDGLPSWRWRVGAVVLERTIAMEHGRAGVAVVHRLLTGGPIRLRLEALCTWRDQHGSRDAGGPPPVATPAPRAGAWSRPRTGCAARTSIREVSGSPACVTAPRPPGACPTPRISGTRGASTPSCGNPATRPRSPAGRARSTRCRRRPSRWSPPRANGTRGSRRRWRWPPTRS